MVDNVKIGVICDIHLPNREESPQYAFLKLAVEQMKKAKIQTVICLGDITNYGEPGAWDLYDSLLSEFQHYEVAGNSDVRNPNTRKEILSRVGRCELSWNGRRLIGINTPDAEITDEDKAYLEGAQAGDILFMHHYAARMKAESAQWLEGLAGKSALTILHGHSHKKQDSYMGQTHVLGLRALDPDKAVGSFPCVYYLQVENGQVTLEEQPLLLPKEYLEDTSRYFGISCVDNYADVTYAAEHNVKSVELRCNGSDWEPDMALIPTLETWRQKTNGYLSVHMPNLRYADGKFRGQKKWLAALDYAIAVKADSLTIHPPRVSVADMKQDGQVWNQFLEFYLKVVTSVPETTKIGIENLHSSSGEILDENRGFGYKPEEVTAWISELNWAVGKERVGHVLDVGHARNNGLFSERYPLGVWYCIMGSKTIAYHIHQVVPIEDGYLNHNAIENWFGPLINYTSFFQAWHAGLLNHVPVFLEVKGHENYHKSILAFQELIKELYL